METLLTGIKPTGIPHLGNYAGAIAPALARIADTDARAVLFVADGHALNSVTDPAVLARHSFEVAATYLACGLDPSRAVFFRQSDVPEIFALASILACVCPKGLTNRGHAYKAAVAANEARGADPDEGVNMGLFGYPILMAADILAFDATVVPVGDDQRQHVEIARTLARRLNHAYGDRTVVVPRLEVDADTGELPGLDGRKMSKSYGNHIPLVTPRDRLRKAIGRMVTDTRRPGEPADPDQVPLYALARAFGDASHIADALRAGAGYADVKTQVFEHIDAHLAPIRDRYATLTADPSIVHDALAVGAVRARDIATGVLSRVKRRVGLRAKAANA